jgi:hypothetical protein
MKSFIHAFLVVSIWSYLPVMMLALSEPGDDVRRMMPVIPGWLVWFFTPRNENVQYWAAAGTAACLILGLSWFGTKGRLPLRAAGFLALLNSFTCVAIHVVFSAVMAASRDAR